MLLTIIVVHREIERIDALEVFRIELARIADTMVQLRAQIT